MLIFCAVWNIDSAACYGTVTISKRRKHITTGGNTLFDCSTGVNQACLEMPREGRRWSTFTFGSAGRVGEVVTRKADSTWLCFFSRWFVSSLWWVWVCRVDPLRWLHESYTEKAESRNVFQCHTSGKRSCSEAAVLRGQGIPSSQRTFRLSSVNFY